VRERRRLTVLFGLAAAAADLAVKAAARDPLEHARPLGIAALSAALAVAVIAIVPRLPSRAAAIAGGIAIGGAIGNGASSLFFGAVPDPLVTKLGGTIIAFNLADVFAIGGATGLVSAACIYALRHPEALRRPI
jgi:lipoprotein signal peptidase